MFKLKELNPSLKNLKQRNGSTFNQRLWVNDATKTYSSPLYTLRKE